MSPNIWGPPIWTFFHTLAEKINDDSFQMVFPILFNFIKRICRVLPCPECSEHATRFLSKINPEGVRNKNDFRNIMWIFHNIVNKRKNKLAFDPSLLSLKYGNNGLVDSYNGFVAVFHTKGNMQLLAETFQRKLVLTDFRKWFLNNIRFFLPRPTIQEPVSIDV
jgi:Erv1 / Alr family